MKIKKLICVIMSLALFAVTVSFSAVAGNSVKANTDPSRNRYSSDWRYWSQGATQYVNSKMQSSGCRVVAQAKLLMETGVAAGDLLFNPDRYIEWASPKFFSDSRGFQKYIGEQTPQGIAPTAYAAEKNIDLKYAGEHKFSSITSIQSQIDEIMAYIKAGYYVIVGKSSHHAYIGRQASLDANEPIIFNSQSDFSYWDSLIKSYRDYCSKKGCFSYCRLYYLSGNAIDGGTITAGDATVNVYTDTVTELTDTGARLNGHFTASKNVHITEHGAYMGTDPNNMVKAAVDKVNYNKSKLTMFYRTGKYYGDLTPGTTYYYRQYVVADDKEFKGDIVSFTTPGQSVPPDETEKPSQPIPVSPPAAPSITVSSDTIYVGQSATIRWNSVADTLVYSLIISGTKVGADQFDGSNTSYVLSNLPEGTYTIRLYASGSGGTSPESNTVTLKVIPKPSAHHVYTAPATNITATSAQLNGSFSSDTKPHMTEHGAYMGTDPNAMTKVAVDKVNYYKSSLTMFYSTSKYNISLTPGTTYYFCEYAIVDGIEIRGDISSFTTLPKQVSNNNRVYTAPATNITATSAQLNGSFSSDAKPHMTEHGAYMGTDPNAMTKVAVDKVDYYKSSLTMFYSTSKYYGFLSPDTTYYFCEYAVLDGVEVRGETLSFTTSKQQSSSIRNGVIRGTVGNLSIRSGPGTSYTKLGRIPEGATCTVDLSRTSGSWYWVTYNGISGYASKNYIVLR